MTESDILSIFKAHNVRTQIDDNPNRIARRRSIVAKVGRGREDRLQDAIACIDSKVWLIVENDDRKVSVSPKTGRIDYHPDTPAHLRH